MDSMDAELKLMDGDDYLVFTADTLGGDKQIVSVDVCFELSNLQEILADFSDRTLKDSLEGISIFAGDRNNFCLTKQQVIVLRDFLNSLLEAHL